MITTTPQPDGDTTWQVTEQILERIKIDPFFADRYADKSLHLDWWWEQPFFEGVEYALPGLCIYIESNVISQINEAKNRDRLTVNFTLYMEWRSNADSHVGALSKNNFLLFAPFAVAIHRALNGYKSVGMHSSLRRIAGPLNVPGLERKGVLISQTYQCVMYDCTASPERMFAEILELNVDGSLIVPTS